MTTISDKFWRQLLLGLVVMACFGPLRSFASCAAPANAIEAENCLPGNPYTQWDIPTADMGDPTIQGFATDISINQGGTINFKVNTPASAWTLDIYRLGYYAGLGARKVASLAPSVRLPQSQPACLVDQPTLLTDCGNWAVSASWVVPANATSGVYIGKLTRTDTGGTSHMIFIVRNDASHSDVLFQTSDPSWQAYNHFSPDFYDCMNTANCRGYKLSYNRPFTTRSVEPETWVFNAEFPMIKWLEANGYDVTYFAGVDTDRSGALLKNHKLVLSNGHDEYWSGGQRASVEAAIAAGVNFAAFSANTSYWKTRWESAIDGSGSPYRTLVCYKETWANARIDPLAPGTWTGTWRDPRFSPSGDGGRPENAFLGSQTIVAGPNLGDLIVPQADGKLRFWRNTSVARLATGQAATLSSGILSSELDSDVDNGQRPAGLMHLTTTNVTSDQVLLDFGNTVGTRSIVHNATLYRNASGARVFASGSYNWAWGLDADHDRSNLGAIVDPNMQQATVNLFADMGVQPQTLQPGLVAASASTDVTPPTSLIVSPASGAILTGDVPVTVTGTASDLGGGVVAGVEVSTDGGSSWHPASGRESWTYAWTPTMAGSITVLSRAVDDSGNLETPGAGAKLTVSGTSFLSIFPVNATPANPDVGADASVELGVRFVADYNGFIKGIRFYKAAANTGTHMGNLWTSSGTLLATATFSAETASGWQQVLFATPVAITAGTTYVASYHAGAGHYSGDANRFIGNGFDNAPLHALGTDATGSNGVYTYGASSLFPSQSYSGTNYWVDVVYSSTDMPTAPLGSIAVTPATASVTAGGATQQFSATGTFTDGSTLDITQKVSWASSNVAAATISSAGLVTPVATGTSNITATMSGKTGSASLTVQPAALSITTTALPGGSVAAPYTSALAASGGTAPYSWSVFAGTLPPGLSLNAGTGVIAGTPTVVGSTSFTVMATDSSAAKASITRSLSITIAAPAGSVWPATAVPATPDAGADGSAELGMKFRSDVAGYINGVRFYKAATNTGTHVGNLWSLTGTLLASATFTAETASGWQQVNFAKPVAIAANTVYLVSYHAVAGHYSYGSGYFTGKGVDNPPLHALADGVSGGNGVYSYGSGSVFPSQTYAANNYWVDVAFGTNPPALTFTPPTLATGLTGIAYSATLSAAGGTAPYTWSLASGALPAGLSLNASTGVISGTPTAAGTFGFSVKVVDASASPQTVTAALTLTVAASGGVSLWPGTTVPAVVDVGADSPVELGVRFKSDSTGHIASIRFYKSAANTGTHVANLWSSTGALLATATFTGETASGWQQVNFATPVAISAGAVYVASYHTNVGHYADNNGYFSGAGYDSAPLHALADGVSGANGVYAYGSNSSYPSSGYQGSNYWIDVVFTP
ncbi:MAG: DUF4082 domain-containing protein [Pseudomonadota bacterium]|nr:DUF4082 domain-containing protein [Pseudomonadota bacterium]